MALGFATFKRHAIGKLYGTFQIVSFLRHQNLLCACGVAFESILGFCIAVAYYPAMNYIKNEGLQ